jgi:hypothetical protein
MCKESALLLLSLLLLLWQNSSTPKPHQPLHAQDYSPRC